MAADGRVNAFHFHVRTFDQTDRQRFTTLGDSLGRPLDQPSHHATRIRHVGLQRDTGSHFLQTLSLQRLTQNVGGQIKVAILLHIQIHKLALTGVRIRFL